MSCNSAVLLIFFNRSGCLQKVFEQIREAKPRRLYLAQDGPREGYPSDIENIEACRRIVENVDWECEVFKKYSSSNFGCGRGPYNAITWAFEQEESVIVLEDDCVPSQSFFYFCDAMLEKYKDDQRIFLISGCNFELKSAVNASYFFGYAGTNWGWASWKRNWNMMDYDCNWTLNKDTMHRLYRHISQVSLRAAKIETSQFRKTNRALQSNNDVSYWDIQWQALRYLNHQISIIPSINLISNIGTGEGSTHAKGAIVSHKTSEIGKVNFFFNETFDFESELKHPEWIFVNDVYDKKIYRHLYPNFFARCVKKAERIIFKIFKRDDT